MRQDLMLPNENGHVIEVKDQFFSQFSFVVDLGQYFGLMPLSGDYKKDINGAYFKWKSVKIVYSAYNIIGAFVSAIFCLAEFFKHGLHLDKTGTMTFYILNCFGAIQFISIAQNWNVILKEWTYVEMSMQGYKPVPNLKRRFIFLTTIIMTLAAAEHLLFILNSSLKSQQCTNTTSPPVEVYFKVGFPHVFTVIDFSIWRMFFVEVANVLSTFTWNYTDLFIILISSSLAIKFRQIVGRIEERKETYEKFWRETREDFNKLTQLTRTIDKHLAPLVVISFVNNTFFICIQLYNSLKERDGTVEKIYFFYSFGFLLFRTASVSMYGSWINEESKRPLETLHSVSSEHYTIEISRFVEQISSKPIAITGSNFFLVTRSFLLRLMGTIITFELMLLQFGPLIKNDYTNNMNNTITDCMYI